MSIKISYSSASRFKTCPQKYYHSQKYQSKLKPSAFAFGTAIEHAVTQLIMTRDYTSAVEVFSKFWQFENGSTKTPVLDNPNIEYNASDYSKDLLAMNPGLMKSIQEELGLEEMDWHEAFETYSDRQKRGLATEEEEIFVGRCYWYSCLKRGEIMLKDFTDSILPDIEELVYIDGKAGVQYKVAMTDEDGNELIGYIDYIVKMKNYDKPVILDCKTAASEYDVHKIVTSEQLRTYAASLESVLGECYTGYLVLIKKIKFEKYCPECENLTDFAPQAKKCKLHKVDLEKRPLGATQLLTTLYEPRLLDEQLEDYENVLEAIKNDVNYKNPEACMSFNKPCEFYDLCWKNKKAKEVEHLIIK